MTRKWLLALLAFVLITPALAQVVPLRRPIQIQPLPAPTEVQPNSDFAEKVMTIEEAKARIEQLQRDKREANAKLAEALATIEQMTTRGGSLVRAYCESPSQSRNTAGGTEDCGRYACGDSSGLCKTSCSASPDCSTGFTCDAGQCLTLAEVQARLGG